MPEGPASGAFVLAADRGPHGRAEAGLVALLLALAAAGWVVTDERMSGMDAGPGSELGAVGWFAISWLLMMAAMMLPAITPVVVAHSRSASGGATAAFAAGYLVTWVAAGLLGYAAIEGVRSLEPGFLAWEEAGRYVAGTVIAAAGLYQLTRPKRAYLRRCRDRRAFLRERPRPGRLVGALRMGVAHGGICVGCSWALMAALLALGAMSLTWMALVAALIAAERLLPWGHGARLTVAVVLIALGTAVALAPGDVPGLTIPDAGMGMH